MQTEAKFTLDITGAVEMRRDLLANGVPAEPDRVTWSDLDLFTQGYVEAFLGGLFEDCDAIEAGPGVVRYAGFSDLAPSTLAAILKDCERVLEPEAHRHCRAMIGAGAGFWEGRQLGNWAPQFLPLTPSLGDDGLVYLREA